MKMLDVVQGSPEWVDARRGIPTASMFDQIVTPSRGELSSSRYGYMAHLLAEWYDDEYGRDGYQGDEMIRGNQLEQRAAAWYEFERAGPARIVRPSLCLTDCGRIGASPDLFIGDDGLAEIKCHTLKTHILGIIQPEGVAAYRCQIQGQLWVTGRKWCDRLRWHPYLEPVVERIERDEVFIEKLATAVTAFADELFANRARFIKR